MDKWEPFAIPVTSTDVVEVRAAMVALYNRLAHAAERIQELEDAALRHRCADGLELLVNAERHALAHVVSFSPEALKEVAVAVFNLEHHSETPQ